MIVQALSLTNFRNFSKAQFTFQAKNNLIIAPNARGKSNLLEALFYFFIGKSYRAELEKEVLNLFQHNTLHFPPFSCLQTQLQSITPPLTSFTATITFQLLSPNSQRLSKRYTVADQPKRQSDFIQVLCGLLFTPESIEIIQGSPEKRRHFFDLLCSQINLVYHPCLRDYQHIVQQRNSILTKLQENKTPSAVHQLSIWDEQLISKGSMLIEQRAMATALLNKYLTKLSPELFSKEKFQIFYRASVSPLTKNMITEFQHRLMSYQTRELAAGTTLIGPHRDNWEFTLAENNLRIFGSRGQQRLAIIALLQAALELLETFKKQQPIVLLDDVFSELDEEHTKLLTNFLQEKPYQVFITSTSEKIIPKKFLAEATIITL